MDEPENKNIDITLNFPWKPGEDPNFLREREWLVTNGTGGYSSGTLLGEASRRYHGLFIPNLPAPRGRTVMIPRLDDWVMTEGRRVQLSGGEFSDHRRDGEGQSVLENFRLNWQRPVWTYAIEGRRLQKRLTMPYGQNTTYITYKLESGEPLTLHLRPYVTFRPHDEALGHPPNWTFGMTFSDGKFEVLAFEGAPPLRLALRPERGVFVAAALKLKNVFYSVERERGLDDTEDLYSPGYFDCSLKAGESIALVASVESWPFLAFEPEVIFEAEKARMQKMLSLAAPAAQEGWARHLVLAADQFNILPGSRVEENALLQASGDRVRTLIAGYHWFTDWGRDTMISLEGLTLCTGRLQEARAILRTFSHYVRNGLLPNHFPEGQRTAVYHTVDATLWYFHALDRYMETTGDQETLAFLYPTLRAIIEYHQKGTDFGIGLDATDGLLREGSPEFPLTWMDAKADDWIVTPRRGKPVEIQALWYNALHLMAEWAPGQQVDPTPFTRLAEQSRQSFNRKYWYDEGNYLYDVIEGEAGDDASLRPNQIFSFSLKYPILHEDRWARVLEVVGHRLWTPVGLRTLDPSHPDYRARYEGSRRSRDGAYHQGLVWAWLIGPYVDAWRRVHPNPGHVEHLLNGFEAHLRDGGVGTISEIFDAERPHTSRGCIAQAWSVAEVLRILVRAAKDRQKQETAAVSGSAR